MRRKAHLHTMVAFVMVFFIGAMGMKFSYAEGYPDWKQGTVQDESGQLPLEAVDTMNAEFASLPYPTKVLVLDTIAGDLSEFIESAFQFYELQEDQLFAVFVFDLGQMAAMAGADLSKKGITPTRLATDLNSYFRPLALEGDFVGGISLFISELYTGIEPSTTTSSDTDTESSELNEQAGKETSASDPASETTNKKKKKASPSLWVYVVAVLFVIVAALLVFLFMRRKQLYLFAEQLEERKDELVQQWGTVNLHVAVDMMQEEVALRLANLETTYEDYQHRIFPDLDSDFHDVYNLLSRFRIIAAREILDYTEKTLEEGEFLLRQLRNETNGYSPTVSKTETSSEPASERVSALSVDEDLYAPLSSDWTEDTIAHVPSTPVEVKIAKPTSMDRLEPSLHRLYERIDSTATQYGISLSQVKSEAAKIEDELEALHALEMAGEENQQLFTAISEKIQELMSDLGKVEQLSHDIEEHIPNRLKELEYKAKEIVSEAGTELAHKLKDVREKWNSLITLWDEGQVGTISTTIQSINIQLHAGEEMIVQEVKQSKVLQETITFYDKRMQEIMEVYERDQDRFEKLYRKYQLEDDPIIDQIKHIDTLEKELDAAYQSVLDRVDRKEIKTAFDLATSLPEKVDQFASLIATFHNRIDTLSTEEERYSMEIKSLRNRLRLVRQQLDRSLLPGKQEQILELIEEGLSSILETEVLFDQLPLRLNKIAQQLHAATDQVAAAEEMTRETIENAKETEHIIRRINIYRTSVPQVAQFLMMAENAYRDQNFAEAVAYARKAEALLQSK